MLFWAVRSTGNKCMLFVKYSSISCVFSFLHKKIFSTSSLSIWQTPSLKQALISFLTFLAKSLLLFINKRFQSAKKSDMLSLAFPLLYLLPNHQFDYIYSLLLTVLQINSWFLSYHIFFIPFGWYFFKFTAFAISFLHFIEQIFGGMRIFL